jgi:hypothetical protein
VNTIPYRDSFEFLLKSKWLLIYNIVFKRAFYVREIPDRQLLKPNDVILKIFDSFVLARDIEFLINRSKKVNRTYSGVIRTMENNVTQCCCCKKYRRHRKKSCGEPIDFCYKCACLLIAKHSRTLFINSKKMMWFLGDLTNVWNNSMYRLSYQGYVYMFQKHKISLSDLAKEKYPLPPEFRKKYAALKKKYVAKIEEYNSYITKKGRTIKKFDYPQLYEKEIAEIDQKITGLKYAALQRGERTIRPLCKVEGKKQRKRGKPVKILKRPYESQRAKYERQKQLLLAMIRNTENERK